MLSDLESQGDIVRLTNGLLEKAEAYGRFPTPIDDIVSAAEFIEVPDTFLANASIEEAPSHLRPILRKLKGRARGLFDRKTREIHVDPEIDNAGREGFVRLHETCHGLFPWQDVRDRSGGFADNDLCLSPRTNSLFEREANQGAAELLFQRARFEEIASEYQIGIAEIFELSQMFGASRHSTFRRFVETHRGTLAGVVLETRPEKDNPLTYKREEAFCSSSWLERFEHPRTWPRLLADPFSFVEQARACSSFGVPTGAWSHIDLNNDPATLQVEARSNSYKIFVLIWAPQRQILKRRRKLVTAN